MAKDSDVNYVAIGAKRAGGAETISRREPQRSRDNRGIRARQKAVRLAAVAAACVQADQSNGVSAPQRSLRAKASACFACSAFSRCRKLIVQFRPGSLGQSPFMCVAQPRQERNEDSTAVTF